jgi:hypothetical protein
MGCVKPSRQPNIRRTGPGNWAQGEAGDPHRSRPSQSPRRSLNTRIDPRQQAAATHSPSIPIPNPTTHSCPPPAPAPSAQRFRKFSPSQRARPSRHKHTLCHQYKPKPPSDGRPHHTAFKAPHLSNHPSPPSPLTHKPVPAGSDGPHEADGAQVDGRQGAAEAAGDEGGAQVGAGHGGREEAAPVPPGHRGAAGDPQVPEEHGAADPEAAVPAAGAGDRAGLQDGPPVPVLRRGRAAGGRRGLPRGPLRGHQPLRHPRQARHHHAQRHPARAPHPGREGLSTPGLYCDSFAS